MNNCHKKFIAVGIKRPYIELKSTTIILSISI